MTAGEMEAEDILSLHLRPADEPMLPAFRGGQHVVLRLPLPEGGSLVRCYSLSGPSGGGVYRISVKLARDASGARGLMSAALHGLKGKAPVRVALRAPKGGFILRRPTTPAGSIVLVAGGIGVTPLLAMLHQLRADKEEAPIRFLYGVRSPDELAFACELKAIAAARRSGSRGRTGKLSAVHRECGATPDRPGRKAQARPKMFGLAPGAVRRGGHVRPKAGRAS